MYRKYFILTALLISISFASFAQDGGIVTGSDKDEHGCVGSAGYTYSNIKKECIRVFDEKIQLKETNAGNTYTTQATLVFSTDKKKVEVFFPAYPAGVILKRMGKKGDYIWAKDDLILMQRKDYRLMKDKKVIYSGM